MEENEIIIGNHDRLLFENPNEDTLEDIRKTINYLPRIDHRLVNNNISIPTIQPGGLEIPKDANYAIDPKFEPKPVDSNAYINSYRWVPNPLYNEENPNEPKYKLVLSRIPVFRQNSNEYTDEALEIMKLYKEPDIQKYVKKFSKPSTTEIMKYLNSQVNNRETNDSTDDKEME